MTNEEICAMIKSGTGDRLKLLEQLYLQNAGMIEKIVRRYEEIEDPEDLRQESFFGIVRAADLFDPNKDVKFMTYAHYWVWQTVQRYIGDCGAVVRIPGYKRALIARYNKAVNGYRMKFGRDPDARELCAALELTTEALEDLQQDIQAARIRSISEPIGGENDDITLGDTIPAAGDQYAEVLDAIQAGELRAVLWDCVDDLQKQHADVIRNRYRDGKTPEECARAMGITSGKARRLEFKALRTLEQRHARRLRPYLTDWAAYSEGLKHTGINAFNRSGSVQEWLMMQIEERSGRNLYNGAKTSDLVICDK